MPLTQTADLCTVAANAGRGVLAFNVILMEHAEAFVRAAEQVGTAVVLQISENCVRYHGGLEPIGAATLALARTSTAPVAVHLDHAETLELVREAIDLGFTSVMYDGSRLPFDHNVATTAEVVRLCHPAGVSVEAELGEVGGKDGVHAPGARTDPADATAFVASTTVDALAVAVGSSHAMTSRNVALDYELIAALRASVPVPLVLHGSSGVPDEGLASAIRAGITKINIATHLNSVFTETVRAYLAENEDVVDPRKYVGHGRQQVEFEAARLLSLLSSSRPRGGR